MNDVRSAVLCFRMELQLHNALLYVHQLISRCEQLVSVLAEKQTE